MNELSTIEGLPGWDALPTEERLKVRKLHAACREIAATAPVSEAIPIASSLPTSRYLLFIYYIG